MKKFLVLFLLWQSYIHDIQSMPLAPPDSCLTPTHYLCTQPIIPNIICPEFCLDGDYTIISAHALFDCSITLMGTCVRYIALPGFIATDFVQVIACNAITCDTSMLVINVVASPDLCTTDPPDPPPCQISPASICTDWDNELQICPDFCFTSSHSLTSVTSAHSSDIALDGTCFLYTPLVETVSWDMITVIACSEAGLCDTLQINIVLGDCNQTPAPTPNQTCTNVFTPIDLCFEMEAGEIFIAEEVETTFQCSITAFAQSCITYYPLPGFSGVDTVIIPICRIDDPDNCRMQQFVVFVGCPSPVAVNDIAYISPSWVSINGSIITDDYGYDGIIVSPAQNDFNVCLAPLVLNVLTPPKNGELIVLPDLQLQYTPYTGFSGTETIQLQMCDPCGQCSASNLTLYVAAQTEINTSVHQTSGSCEADNNSIKSVYYLHEVKELSVSLSIVPNTEAYLSIYASNGQLMSFVKILPYSIGQQTYHIPTEGLSKGVYILSLTSPHGIEAEKFMVH